MTMSQGPNLAMTLRNSLIRSGEASVDNIGLAPGGAVRVAYCPVGTER